MKKYLLIIMVLYAGLSYAQNDSSRFNKFINVGLKPNPKMPWKNPGTTAIHTFFLPGTGYLANDKMLLGCGTFLLESAFLAGGAFSYFYLEMDGLAYAAFGMAGAIHLVQFVHSVSLTHRSNKINGYVMEYPSKSKGAEISLGLKGNGLGLNVRF